MPGTHPKTTDDAEPQSIEEINKEIEKQVEEYIEKPADSPSEEEIPDPEAKPEEAAENKTDAVEPTDPEEDKAVDDIAVHESDEVLAAEDEKVEKAFSSQKTTRWEKVKNFLADWWQNPWRRWLTIITAIVLIVAAAVVPYSRYFILNNLGVRASSSLTVLDASTTQPLKNVKVTIGRSVALTDSEGRVSVRHLKLGATAMTIEKRAFATIQQKVTIGWGSNPQGNINLTPTGLQYTFNTTDFLSGKPVANAEADAGDASAVADDNGKIVLTIDKNSDENLATIKAIGYRDEQIDLSLQPNQYQYAIKMVPANKHVFVSKRSGKYDLYKIDADGKNEQLLLAGTGSERDDLVLVPNATEGQVAYVSTRDNARNSDGFLLSSLVVINVKTGEVTKVAQSERIQIVGWLGSKLVYTQVAAGASAADPHRSRLKVFDYKTADNRDLASSNYFNDVALANGQIFWAPSSTYQAGGIGLFRIGIDGTGQQNVISQETWNIVRTSYDHFNLSVGQSWYDYTLSTNTSAKAAGAPANMHGRTYIDDTNRQHSLWVDNRDGKGVLLMYDVSAKTDKTLLTQGGLGYPLYWLNDKYAVYRIHTDQETADYLLNIDGGNPRKIQDVSNVTGITTWYY